MPMDEGELAEFLAAVVPPGEVVAARASGSMKKFVVGWTHAWVVLTDRRLRVIRQKTREVIVDAALDDQLTVVPTDRAQNNLLWVRFRSAGKKVSVGFPAQQAGYNRAALNDATVELLDRLAPYTRT